MNHPHNYNPGNAPKAYLKRIFIASRPRQITIAGLIGAYRLHVLDMKAHYQVLKNGNGEPFIANAIISDRGGIHGVFGPVKHYLLVIDKKPIALYDTEGRFIEEATDEALSSAYSSARLESSDTELRLKDDE